MQTELTYHLAIYTVPFNIKHLPNYIDVKKLNKDRLNYLVISLFSLNTELEIVQITTKPFKLTDSLAKHLDTNVLIKHNDHSLALVNEFCKLMRLDYKDYVEEYILYMSPQEFIETRKKEIQAICK